MDVLRIRGPESVPNQVVAPEPAGREARGRAPRASGVAEGLGGLPRPRGDSARCRHSSGTAARPAGGRARTGATENLGSRRRLGGGTSVSEGSDAVGSVKGVHALEREPFGRPFRKRFCVCCTRADHRSPHPRSWQLLRYLGRFRGDGSTIQVLCFKSFVSSPLIQVLYFRSYIAWFLVLTTI